VSISSWIAKTGENPNFIAFMAHASAAGFITLAFPSLWLAVSIVVGTAIKEFWFDLRYEKDPPQTIDDSLLDFCGYCTGVGAALLKVYIV
jgi:hypothetical protein